MALDTIGAGAAAELTSAVRRFVDDDLAGDRAIWVAGDWDRTVDTYSRQFNKVVASCCSACQYPGNRLGGIMRISVTAQALADAGVMAELVAAAQLPARATQCLDAGDCRAVWVWMDIRWPQPGSGHAAFFVFDVKRRTQVYFDPHWGIDRAGYVSTLLCQRRFHPRFRPAALADCGWPSMSQSLQHVIQQRLHFDEHGMCGILCTVVMITCIRFNYYNPLHVARMLSTTMTQANAHVANQLITWYDEMIPKTGDAFRAHAFPESVARRCHAFSPSTRRLCSRPSCRQGPLKCMCWQHRFLGLNRRASRRGCAEPQAQC